jgi:hypothetical protein
MPKPVLSQKRYDQMCASINALSVPHVDKLITTITTIMNFDKGKTPVLSQTRYNKILAFLDREFPQSKEGVASIIRQVLNYDPDDLTYLQKQKEANKKYYERKKAEGISTYVISGQKTHYYKMKAALAAMNALNKG